MSFKKLLNSVILFLILTSLASACNIPLTSAPIITPTSTPTMRDSLRVPEILSSKVETIYDQSRRARLGGRDTTYWPDGNIGFIPVGDKFRLFAANGDRTAIMLGSFDDPGATVEATRLTVEGSNPEFAYLAGGPIYRDPESGMLLMFYHAERHFEKNGAIFHASLGLAASHDEGKTFQDLGIILENNAQPDPNARCCAEMGGATYAIKDGQFYVYFKDRMQDLTDVFLGTATAPIAEVVASAREGKTSPWYKYYYSQQEPGLSGRSSPLELGNPPSDWFSVSYNTLLKKFIMVISAHTNDQSSYSLNLITSDNGYEWSPRIVLHQSDGELFYPSIISPDGDPINTGKEFYIYFVSTPPGEYRWKQTELQRMTIALTGNMVEMPHEWEFETEAGGWAQENQMGSFQIINGTLVIEPTGPDPYMSSPSLGLSGDFYKHIEVRMRAGQDGTAQFFFTGTQAPNISESASVRFSIEASDEFVTHTIDMSKAPAWKGLIGMLRFDPIDRETTVEIDYIRLLP